eukprot:m.1195826 g.1195826  ORF g.1195826 m.1195826 type:complete len:364 (+) comp24563_c0_seq35:827-1918(+)
MWGLESSTSIHLTQLTLEHGGWFTMLATNCSDLVITDVTVKADRDGLDIVGCRDVVVDRVSVTGGGDDAIVLKSDFSLGAVLHTNNVTVTNAVVSCGCNGLNFGSETVGDFSDVYWANITVLSAGKAGIGVVSMDGANIFNVIYRNISIRECYTPLFFFIGARLRRPDTAHPGSISGVYLDTISVDHSTYKGKGNVTATIDGEPAVTNIEEVYRCPCHSYAVLYVFPIRHTCDVHIEMLSVCCCNGKRSILLGRTSVVLLSDDSSAHTVVWQSGNTAVDAISPVKGCAPADTGDIQHWTKYHGAESIRRDHGRWCSRGCAHRPTAQQLVLPATDAGCPPGVCDVPSSRDWVDDRKHLVDVQHH